MLKYVDTLVGFSEIPDEITLCINISNCPNNCEGCHSPWLWSNEGDFMTDEFLKSLIGKYSAAITCFCFMGGDAEPDEVERICRLVKSCFPGIKTAWYSGRESIPEGFDIRVLDYLKLGPYIEALGGLKSPETNQALYRIGEDSQMERIFL